MTDRDPPLADHSDTRYRDLSDAHYRVAIVGGGQAGLSMSHRLRERDIEHLVVEAERVGHEWRERRWDSFCLVTPNWQCRLPGSPYLGPDPHGFMTRDEVVRYLEAYASFVDPPLVEGVRVTRLEREKDGGFVLSTTAGRSTADQVVVATGPYHVPAIPSIADQLPLGVRQLHSSQYRNAGGLPEGAVLVVGSGQSGCQIAEELHLAGRRVHLAVGGAPRVARFYRGRDSVAWLAEMGHYSKRVDDFTDAEALRMRANHYVTGRDGGRDLDLRALARDGMCLHGRLVGAGATRLEFADGLRADLDAADAVADGIKDAIDAYIVARGIEAPRDPRHQPVWEPPHAQARHLDLAAAGINSVIWCTGFVRDYGWIEVPIFDGRGRPMHNRGVTGQPGLYLLGLPWQHTWGSARFEAVGRDAEFLAGHIDAFRRVTHRRLAHQNAHQNAHRHVAGAAAALVRPEAAR